MGSLFLAIICGSCYGLSAFVTGQGIAQSFVAYVAASIVAFFVILAVSMMRHVIVKSVTRSTIKAPLGGSLTSDS